jgi:malate dehydrogenase (oxaloacetate-decarboxylating)
MFLAAAKTLATLSPAIDDPTASLLPPVDQVRATTRFVALAVAKQAVADGVSRCKDVEKGIAAHVWEPHYPKYVSAL